MLYVCVYARACMRACVCICVFVVAYVRLFVYVRVRVCARVIRVNSVHISPSTVRKTTVVSVFTDLAKFNILPPSDVANVHKCYPTLSFMVGQAFCGIRV